ISHPLRPKAASGKSKAAKALWWRYRWLVASGLVILLGGPPLAGVLLSVRTPIGTIIVEVDQPELTGAAVSVDGQQRITIKPSDGQEPIELVADEKKHTLQVTKG